jgi:hypothetical protein
VCMRNKEGRGGRRERERERERDYSTGHETCVTGGQGRAMTEHESLVRGESLSVIDH